MTAAVTYRYRALTSSGSPAHGELEAPDRDAAARALAGRGLIAAELCQVEPSQIRHAITWRDLALGLQLLSNLLEAGLPMDRALGAFSASGPPAWKRVLPGIRRRIGEGISLSEALKQEAPGIPALVTEIIHAGELGIGVAPAVHQAAGVAGSIAETRAAIGQALVYPGILLAAGTASIGFMAVVVLPRFAAILADFGQTLPTTTRLVLAGASMIGAGWLPAAVAGACVIVAWRAWTAGQPGLRRWHRFLRSLPLLGEARKTLATGFACETLGAMIASGVPLPTALRHGAASCGDALMSDDLVRAREAIVQGRGIASALEGEDAFTTVALGLIRTGEETGRLGPMLREAGRIELDTARNRIRSAILVIEPAFILLFGGLVALVAAALLQALYGIRPV